MRIVRPFVTAAFVVGGAYAVSKLVEASLFVGLVNDVAPPDVAAILARVGGVVTIVMVLFGLGWRLLPRGLRR